MTFGRVWIRTHRCKDCGTRWLSQTLYPKVCRACAHRRALAATRAKPKIGRRYEQRACADCGTAWRVRTDAKSKWCKACARIRSARGAKATFAVKRPGRTLDLNCEVCGRIFQLLKCRIPPFNMTTAARGRFCSVDCRSEWQREHWQEIFARPRRKHRRGQGVRTPS